MTYPIIYIRGYAMTEGERNETAADPFCGFNVGSTLYRAVLDKKSRPAKFVFESPLVRLVSDFGYCHVYHNGEDLTDPEEDSGGLQERDSDTTGEPRPDGIASNSIIIYRYYDDGSTYLGDGKAREIKAYANGLNRLILRVRDLVCKRIGKDGKQISPADFRCYLVAHSMGGLVARTFLQNDPRFLLAPGEQDPGDARKTVDKLFTFGTPHNGIDVLGMNVPYWLSKSEVDTFSRTQMADYLNLKSVAARHEDRVDFLPEEVLSSDRVFCMIGTNRGDYEVAKGIVRAFVGHGSDGLVLIENASLWGIDGMTVTKPVASAYAYRSHSGHFGIVNSEEAYQNLVRFLFGDVRVDIWFDIASVTLPPALESKAGRVNALYQIEFDASPRGKRWFLTRRKSVEDSAAARTHKQLIDPTDHFDNHVFLSTAFLAKWARVDKNQNGSLAYAMTLAVKVPDYEIDRKFWPDGHFEGGDLFRKQALMELTPPKPGEMTWEVKAWWRNEENRASVQRVVFKNLADTLEVTMPVVSDGTPGITGKLRLMVQPWS